MLSKTASLPCFTSRLQSALVVLPPPLRVEWL